MGDVVSLPDAEERRLARELRVSVEFVKVCREANISVPEARSVLAWFLSLPRATRIIVMGGVLRSVVVRPKRDRR